MEIGEYMIRKAVFGALDRAYFNGEFAPGGGLHGLRVNEIAIDLCNCDADLESENFVTIAPYVRVWIGLSRHEARDDGARGARR